MLSLLQRLSVRERILVASAAAFLVAALLHGLVLAPALEGRARWRAMAQRKQEELARFEDLAARYRALQASLSEAEARLAASTEKGSLLARLEASARRLGLQGRITSMKPFTADLESGGRESSVEVRLEKLELRGLVDLLAEVEGGSGEVRARKLRVKKRFDDPMLLDVNLTVTTLEAR